MAEARQILRGESLAEVVYRMLRDQAQQLPEYRFHQHLGPQATLLNGSDQVIPGFYTQRGYRNYLLGQGPGRVGEILRDNWVLGEGDSLSPHDLSRLMADMEQLYFRDYAFQWSEALDELAPEPVGNAGQGARLAAGLGSPSSPLVQLLLQVRENTLFGAAVDVPDAIVDKLAAIPGAAALGSRLGLPCRIPPARPWSAISRPCIACWTITVLRGRSWRPHWTRWTRSTACSTAWRRPTSRSRPRMSWPDSA